MARTERSAGSSCGLSERSGCGVTTERGRAGVGRAAPQVSGTGGPTASPCFSIQQHLSHSPPAPRAPTADASAWPFCWLSLGKRHLPFLSLSFLHPQMVAPPSSSPCAGCPSSFAGRRCVGRMDEGGNALCDRDYVVDSENSEPGFLQRVTCLSVPRFPQMDGRGRPLGTSGVRTR